MNFIEYCNKRIGEILTKIKDIDETISKFPKQEDIKIENYGNKNEISRKIKRNTSHKIKNIFYHPSIGEIRKYIRKTEIENLKSRRKVLEEELNQLMKASKSFDLKTNRFISSIFPNNFVIKIMLEYGELGVEKFDSIISKLISLFKISANTGNNNVISKIEHDISISFTDDGILKPEADGINMSFMIEKLFQITVGEDCVNKHEISISGIKTELEIKCNSNQSSEEKRNKLLEKQKVIKELQQYIKNGIVVKATPSREYFENLLNKAGLSQNISKKYLYQMDKIISKIESFENEQLLRKYMSFKEVETLTKISEQIEEITIPEIKKFLLRTLKDVISICKYLELNPLQEEKDKAYEIIAHKIEVLKTAIACFYEEQSEKSTFLYISNSNECPNILSSIETADEHLYPEIYSLLDQLSNNCHQDNSIIVKETTFNIIEGEMLDLIYIPNTERATVVTIVNKTTSPESVLTNNIIEAANRIKCVEKNNSFEKQHIIYEQIILQTLDLKRLNDQSDAYKLRKI